VHIGWNSFPCLAVIEHESYGYQGRNTDQNGHRQGEQITGFLLLRPSKGLFRIGDYHHNQNDAQQK
jgi:hypothetical protein